MENQQTKENDLEVLNGIARDLRLDILDMTTKAGSGHPSSSFSAVEILTAIYFGGILNFNPDDPWWQGRDRFIMSKGHAAPLLYAVLAKAGYFDRQLLWDLRQVNSPVQGHPIQGMLPGVEATTGSLGQGLSLGLGHILGGRLNGSTGYRAYVLLGDGECQEGQIWEAAMFAAHVKADKLTAIVDYNKYQESGPISRELALEPFADKWRAFGWQVLQIDGHDLPEILEALATAQATTGKPTVIIARTIKGKGVSFMEDRLEWHYKSPNKEQSKQAISELDRSL